MDWKEIEKHWTHYRVDAQLAWPRLRNPELDAAAGKRRRLIDKVRNRMRLSQEEAEREVDAWAENLEEASHA